MAALPHRIIDAIAKGIIPSLEFRCGGTRFISSSNRRANDQFLKLLIFAPSWENQQLPARATYSPTWDAGASRGLRNNADAGTFQANLPAQYTFNVTLMEYKGYRIEISRVGKGWRSTIFSPGSKRPLPDSPSNLEKSQAEEIIAEAKRIIDERLSRQLS